MHVAQPPGDSGVHASAYWPDPHGPLKQERTHSASANGGHSIAPAYCPATGSGWPMDAHGRHAPSGSRTSRPVAEELPAAPVQR